MIKSKIYKVTLTWMFSKTKIFVWKLSSCNSYFPWPCHNRNFNWFLQLRILIKIFGKKAFSPCLLSLECAHHDSALDPSLWKKAPDLATRDELNVIPYFTTIAKLEYWQINTILILQQIPKTPTTSNIGQKLDWEYSQSWTAEA